MKYLTLISLTLLTMSAKSQDESDCFFCATNHSYDRVFNLSAGNPFNTDIEVGKAFNHLAYYLGIKVYSTSQITKGGYSETGLPIVPYGRVTYKLINGKIFRAYVNGYGGYNFSKLIYGAGLRLGFIITEDVMLTLEPGINHEQGNFVNAGVSIRF